MKNTDFISNYTKLDGLLLGFAIRLTSNKVEAQELYQETLYKAFLNKEKYKDGTNFKSWITTIMRNTFINGYRKKQTRNRVEQPIENCIEVNRLYTTENKAHSNIMMNEIWAAIKLLKKQYSDPFLLFYQGFHYNEISKVMNLPIGTVKSRIFTARKKLKGLISKKYNN